jgi:hypothetical protein
MEVASGEYGSYVDKLTEVVKEKALFDRQISCSNSNDRSGGKQTTSSNDEIHIDVNQDAAKDEKQDCHNSLLVKNATINC